MTSTEVEILLVEDSQDDADLALHALRRGKLTSSIYHARDGEEALDFLFCRGAHAHRSFLHPPILVLLDLKLPKIDGIQVLEQTKSDPRTHTIPIVVMTSSSEDLDVERAFRKGANSYVQKPVDFAQFQETVKTIGLYWVIINRHPVQIEAKMG
jgi:two-component system, response regulator